MDKGPHISIKPEAVFEVFGFPVTNSYLAALIVITIFIFLSIYYSIQIKSLKRSSLFYLMQYAVNSMYGFFKNVVGDKIEYLFPLLGSLFIYILLLNWFGLLPGVGSVLVKVKEGSQFGMVPFLRGNTSDLNTTLALAILAFTTIQYYGIKELGIKGYFSKFINLSQPITLFTGVLEIISEFSRIVSFAFRLFGNIFAGEVIISIIAFLIPILASFPFLLLEIFIGFIQAFVFSMLTAVFINLAMAKQH